MIAIARTLALYAGALALLATAAIPISAPGNAMSIEQRDALDMSGYTVKHPGASFFDLDARKAYLNASKDPVLRAEAAKLSGGMSCQQFMQTPVIKGDLAVPLLYRDPDGWKIAAKPFLDFEDAVSRLAAADFVTGDHVYGQCLVNLLASWAKQGAFLDLKFENTVGLQTWFQTEGALLAAALSYSMVRNEVSGMADSKAAIEKWLVAVANYHLSRTMKFDDEGSCCNNHFYRRASYAAMIGVLTGDNRLFQMGMLAVYSALSEASAEGALPREMARGEMAARYQNYATMYLVLIAEIARVQGYDLFMLEVNGRKLGDVVHLAAAMLKDPELAGNFTEFPNQQTEFSQQAQYAAWLEMLPGLGDQADAEAGLNSARRPLYNRSLGGFLTLYFAAAPGGT